MALTRPRASQLNTNTIDFADPLVRINKGQTGTNDKDIGIVLERGTDTNVAFIWDESADQFAVINTDETGNTAGNVTISSYANIKANAFYGDGSNLTGVTSYGDSDVAAYLSANGYGTSSSIIASITDSAPTTLDTLNELAAALGDDANFSTTISTQIGTKLDSSSYTAADVLTKIKTVDGDSSGLDADLLDGQQGTYYLDYNNFSNKPTIPTNNNQLTNGAGYITSADGGNAATLDSLDSTQFLRSDTSDVGTILTLNSLIVGTGFTPTTSTDDHIVNFIVGSTATAAQNGMKFYENTGGFGMSIGYNGTGSGTGNKIVIQSDAAAELFHVYNNTSGDIRAGTSQYKMWHAGNDGAGSGLDADTVDGIQGSSFLRSDTTDTASGVITFSNTTASTSTTTGAVKISGGLGVAGDIYANLFQGTATSAQYADLAENYLADQEYPVGTVLEIGGDAEVTVAVQDSYKVVGTISEAPGYLMNSGLEGEHVVPVAYIGRVPCRVQGTVNRGDFLVVGDTPGVAVAKHPMNILMGTAIGKALEDYDSNEEGVIEILVGRL